MSRVRVGERSVASSCPSPGPALVRPGGTGRWPALSVAVLVGVLLAGCGTSGGADRGLDEPPAGASTPAPPSPSPSAAAAEATATVEAPSEPTATVIAPPSGVLPRATSYGTLDWTVTDAVITNQNPKTYVAGTEGKPTADTSLIVDFEIRNDDPHLHFLTTTSRLVAALPDGSVVPGVDLERQGAPPSSTVEGRYAFEVPAETSFDDVVLRFEDPGREPSADLPLGGPAPAPEENATKRVNESMAIGLPGIEMQWTVGEQIAGRDWPLPIGFKGGLRVASARAELGHRWVGLVARVDVDRCECKGGVLDQAGSARLIVDGSPFTASAGESSKAIMQTSTFSDVQLVFDVPAGATKAVLQIGPLEKPEQQSTMDLDLD